MARLPKIRPETPGIYQTLTAANTDYILSAPIGAIGLVLWFQLSSTDTSFTVGRVGIDANAAQVSGLTGTDNVLGYQPPQAVEYTLNVGAYSQVAGRHETAAKIHLASATAGAIARGMWVFPD